MCLRYTRLKPHSGTPHDTLPDCYGAFCLWRLIHIIPDPQSETCHAEGCACSLSVQNFAVQLLLSAWILACVPLINTVDN